MRLKLTVIILAISLLAPNIVFAVPLLPPEIPVLFYGAVRINQEPAPVGTIISFRQKTNNTEIASSTIQAGRYFMEMPCQNYLNEAIVIRVNNLIATESQCVNVMNIPSVQLDLNLDIAKPAAGGSVPFWLLQQQQLKPVVSTAPAIEPTVKPQILPQVLGVKYYADGALIRGKDKKIYLIANDKLIVIRNWEQLRKYAGQKIYDVADEVIRQYMDFFDGQLIRGSMKKIYVIKNGKKQPIFTLTELRKKYTGQKIYDVSDKILGLY
ncbi:MAG: hypothetical protein V1801_01520 [Candidatus Falkowbacteria bacterium]